MSADPITQLDGAVTVQGEALPLLYRATLALVARHHRDGVSSPTLLHSLRKELFRATTTMSPQRHKDAGNAAGGSCCDGQEARDWCSTGEASFLLGVSRRTIQRLAANRSRDGVEAIRVGRVYMLRLAPLLALAREREALK